MRLRLGQAQILLNLSAQFAGILSHVPSMQQRILALVAQQFTYL
jgi:hypothetical protein